MADKYRPCECLDCGHCWSWPVEYSATTQNLSGEKNIYCPVCNSRDVKAGPHEAKPRLRFNLLPPEPKHTFTAGHGEVQGGRVVIVKQKSIRQSDMTADCFMVQIWGIGYCKKCEYLNTPECGGKAIRRKIKAGQYPVNGLPDQG